MIYHMGRSLMFIRSMRRKQLKDQEFQHRLRTLPDSLGALSDALDILGSESSRGEQRWPEGVELPAVPRIRSNGTIIQFALVPIHGIAKVI